MLSNFHFPKLRYKHVLKKCNLNLKWVMAKDKKKINFEKYLLPKTSEATEVDALHAFMQKQCKM